MRNYYEVLKIEPNAASEEIIISRERVADFKQWADA